MGKVALWMYADGLGWAMHGAFNPVTLCDARASDRTAMRSFHFFRKLMRRLTPILPARFPISLDFYRTFGYIPRLRHAASFNELIQARKLLENDRRFISYSDKVAVKDLVASRLGRDWIIPTLHAGPHLPESCEFPLPIVVKANHGSGWIAFVRSKNQQEWEQLRQVTARWMQTPWPKRSHEWWYNEIERKVLVEPLIGEGDLPDFKFFVFGGRAEFIQVDTDRFTDHKRAFYDRNWRKQEFSLGFPLEHRPMDAPPHLSAMINAAETLGRNFDFVRVDLYDLPSGPKFGEMTFSPGCGFERFAPASMDYEFGKYGLRPAIETTQSTGGGI